MITAMARHAARHAASGDPDRDAHATAEALRDRLTREWLAAAVADRGADVVSFEPRWWDGQSYGRCLVVQAGDDRIRVVETAGEAVVLPFDRRAAGRVLGGHRRSPRAELDLPQPRSGRGIAGSVYIDVTDGDVVRCAGQGCGALLPVERAGPCPRCGAPTGE
jgi:hypothetical protein